jgi:hypothetical protein
MPPKPKTIPIYILRDDDPHGGYYAGQDWFPVEEWERATIVEVRTVDMPPEEWQFIIGGEAPITVMPDQSWSHDEWWQPWWDKGVTGWTREGGATPSYIQMRS